MNRRMNERMYRNYEDRVREAEIRRMKQEAREREEAESVQEMEDVEISDLLLDEMKAQIRTMSETLEKMKTLMRLIDLDRFFELEISIGDEDEEEGADGVALIMD